MGNDDLGHPMARAEQKEPSTRSAKDDTTSSVLLCIQCPESEVACISRDFEPQVLRLRLPKKPANAAQDDKVIML